MTDPTNGGKRINKLEQSDAVQDTKLDYLVEQVRELHDMMQKSFGSDGFCVKNQLLVTRHDERISSTEKWIKTLWGVAVAVLLLAVKAAFWA